MQILDTNSAYIKFNGVSGGSFAVGNWESTLIVTMTANLTIPGIQSAKSGIKRRLPYASRKALDMYRQYQQARFQLPPPRLVKPSRTPHILPSYLEKEDEAGELDLKSLERAAVEPSREDLERDADDLVRRELERKALLTVHSSLARTRGLGRDIELHESKAGRIPPSLTALAPKGEPSQAMAARAISLVPRVVVAPLPLNLAEPRILPVQPSVSVVPPEKRTPSKERNLP